MTTVAYPNPLIDAKALEAITQRKRASAQSAILKAWGVPHYVHPDGGVVVTWTALDAGLLEGKPKGPDLDALRKCG